MVQVCPSLQSRSEECGRVLQRLVAKEEGGQELLSLAPSTLPCITLHTDRAV